MTEVVSRNQMKGLLRRIIGRRITQEEYDSDVTIRDIKAYCEVFTSANDVVSALNDLNRPDLIGEYETVFVDFTEEGEVTAAYGCKSHSNFDSMVVVAIVKGEATTIDEYGLPIQATVELVQAV